MIRAVLAALALLAASPALADVTIGDPPVANTGNCFPFSCDYNGDYQQIYSATAFAGPVTISGLRFYNTQFNSGATEIATGTWSISLSTTATTVAGLNSNPSLNIGADNTQVFSGDLARAWSFGDTLEITFTTPFAYDPNLGNLLVDMDVAITGNANPDVFFDEAPFGPLTRRNYNDGVIDTLALRTTFVTSTATSTPEPASLALLAAGLAAFATLRRRA